MKLTAKNLDEMKKIAYDFVSKLKGNEIIGLKGNLGAGKTTLTKYIGEALEVKEEIISPTFNIVRTYDSKFGPFYHVDAYRLEGLPYDPMLDDYLYDDNALRIVEWFNFLDDPIFDDAIIIEINVVDGVREISINGGIYA